MTETLRLVDWDLATATASRFAPRGPSVTRPEAFDAVRQLRLLAVEAEDHVAAFTGLSAAGSHEPAFVADRTALDRRQRRRVPGRHAAVARQAGGEAGRQGRGAHGERVGSRVTGMQVGLLLAYLSGKVLGQYELFLPPEDGQSRDGRLTLVAPNIVAAERHLDVDPRDFRLWVCVHEVTHRTQFTAVPWLRAHLHDEISAFLLASDLDPSAMLGRLRDVGESVRGNMRRRGSASGVGVDGGDAEG